MQRQQWEKRLKDAKQRLDLANAFVQQVKKDVASGAVDQKSGAEAYDRALLAEEAALREYAKVVEIFGPVIPVERPPTGRRAKTA